MTILEQLYMGNISFVEKPYPPDAAYLKAVQKMFDIKDKLKATLNDEEKELLEQLDEAEGEIGDIMQYDTYTSALKFGVQMMAEIFLTERSER